MYMTKEAKKYKKCVWAYCVSIAAFRFAITDVLDATLYAYPPDKRKRDLDNLVKVILDSLQYAGIIPNDNQVKSIFMEMKDAVPETEGWVLVQIKSRD